MFYFQDPIDINKGVTDEQAKNMAKNLQFKGPLLDEVCNFSYEINEY